MMLNKVIPCLLLLFVLCTGNPIDSPRSEKGLDLSHMCMRVRSQNKNDNQTVLLLHGLGSSKEAWTGLYQVLALKTGKRICAADLRNHGDSPWSDDTDIEAMASDLNPLLETLGVEKVILFGHSLGGKIAIHFSLKNPEKVEKLIVEDIQPNGVPEEALKLVAFSMNMLISALNSVPKGSREKEAKLIVLRYVKESFRKMNLTFPLDERAAEHLPLKCDENECSWKMNVKLLQKILLDPATYLTESSGLFENPALFIYGGASPFRVGEYEEEILKLFPKAKLVPVEGAGHIIHIRPEFLSEVIKFLVAEN